MDDQADRRMTGAPERRNNLALRKTFNAAYPMLEPFFDPKGSWGGNSLEYLASRLLYDNFPELSSDEVQVIVVAAHRVYIDRNPRTTGHLRPPGEVSSA